VSVSSTSTPFYCSTSPACAVPVKATIAAAAAQLFKVLILFAPSVDQAIIRSKKQFSPPARLNVIEIQ